jgi:hypothetical protein
MSINTLGSVYKHHHYQSPGEHAPSSHPLSMITLVPLPPPVTPGPKAAVIRMSRMTGCNVATLLDNKGGV